MLTQQPEIGNGFLALDEPRERLRIGLQQTLRNELRAAFVGVGTGEVIGLGHLIGSQDSVGAAVSQAVCQGLGFGACADAASAPVRAITSHAFSRVLWSNRSMEQVRQLLREALGALEKALSPQGVQVLKFGLLFAVLVAIDCWLIANQHAVFIESGKNVGPLREITWFGLVLLDISGVLNVLGYAVIANRKLFTTLRLPSIIVLTVLTAVASTGPVVQGRIAYYLHDGRIGYLAYPIIVSVVTVLTRYFWFRRKGQLGAAEG